MFHSYGGVVRKGKFLTIASQPAGQPHVQFVAVIENRGPSPITIAGAGGDAFTEPDIRITGVIGPGETRLVALPGGITVRVPGDSDMEADVQWHYLPPTLKG